MHETRSCIRYSAMKVGLNTLLAAVLLLIFPSAFAALGSDYSSVSADSTRMMASTRMLPAQQYSAHVLQVPSGTVVREYVSTAGKVFAVSWHGPQMPDLRQLFGSYFSEFKKAARAKRGLGSLNINQPGLVIVSGGHMRAFAGLAYVPQLVPQGVSITSLK